jgi:hypothetical protein
MLLFQNEVKCKWPRVELLWAGGVQESPGQRTPQRAASLPACGRLQARTAKEAGGVHAPHNKQTRQKPGSPILGQGKLRAL